jgi:Na+-translocating ferredoxin:NAD+ oxidoreductase RNF subunit RnfB
VASLIQSILTGWVNVFFETPEVKAMAEARAVHCGECVNAGPGLVAEMIDDEIREVVGLVCTKCNCPLSAKIRSPYEKCPIGLWQAITK